jgi:hypothetical protein
MILFICDDQNFQEKQKIAQKKVSEAFQSGKGLGARFFPHGLNKKMALVELSGTVHFGPSENFVALLFALSCAVTCIIKLLRS